MTAAESHKPTDDDRIFDRQAFGKAAVGVLSELRDVVQRNLHWDDLYELQSKSIWGCSLPSFRDDVLCVLFERFPPIRDAFDFRHTASKLCTLENLERLVKDKGAERVARTFRKFFEIHAVQHWSILIPLENVVVRDNLPEIKGQSVCVRLLTEDEKTQLIRLHVPTDSLDGYCFVTEQQAGDAQSAVAKARASIQEFIAPYYLHRIRSPERWWRARTIRQIISPLAFYIGPEALSGANRELRQLPTKASDLFTPDPEMDAQWQAAVETVIEEWHRARDRGGELGNCLSVCSRWMFAAETEEDPENAFLKHGIAWEALLPDCSRIRRGWYLLLLSIGSCDPLCLKTVSQAGRLTDRRNSLAHPKIARQLYGTLEQDLCMLKQSLRWAFDNMIDIWPRCEVIGDKPCTWPEVLHRTFDSLCSENFSPDDDDAVFLLLTDLILLEEDPDGASKPVLTREGLSLRVEALIVKAHECWSHGKDPKSSVCHLVRGLHIANGQFLPMDRYHVLLSLKERLAEMNRPNFEEGCTRARTGTAVLKMKDIDHEVEMMERKHGLRPESVGWKRP